MGLLRRNPRTDRSESHTGTLASFDVRALTLASGAGRIAIGVGLALAPRQALAALGFTDAPPATVAVARIAGGRDIAMGAETLLARGDRVRLARSSLSNAAVDAGDALAFSAALAAGDQVRGAARRGVAGALPAAAAGLWVAWRLGTLPPKPGI